jgi:hypothetical protein
MERTSRHLYLLLMIVGLTSCMTSSKRKSEDYYRDHQTVITEMRKSYDKLYRQQPFSAGFTDKSYKYYVMEVNTDTVRYIYNTEKAERAQLNAAISRFQYDTAILNDLALKMKSIKCPWLSKASFYVAEKRETVTYLSFKSAKNSGFFVENKYYILIFLEHPITSEDIKARIKKGDLVKIDKLVYFTIGNKFR